MHKQTGGDRMKRAWHYIIGVVLAVAALAALFLAVHVSKSHDDMSAAQTSSTQASVPNQACQIFTLNEAKALMGAAKGGQNQGGQSSADLVVSTCSYVQSGNSPTAATDRKSASLLARVPKTDKGIASNNNEFGTLRPTTVQDVSGYGDHAYWDPEHGQLNILKNNNWYILSYGLASPASRNLEQTQQLADLLIGKM